MMCTYFEETHYVEQIERKIIIGEASWQTLMNGNKSSYNDFSFWTNVMRTPKRGGIATFMVLSSSLTNQDRSVAFSNRLRQPPNFDLTALCFSDLRRTLIVDDAQNHGD